MGRRGPTPDDFLRAKMKAKAQPNTWVRVGSEYIRMSLMTGGVWRTEVKTRSGETIAVTYKGY